MAKNVRVKQTSSLTLQQRLRQLIGRNISIEAEGFASEAGRLNAVTRNLIRVMQVYFVPQAVNRINVFNLPTNVGRRINILTTFSGGQIIPVRLVALGRDYVEINVNGQRTLIPLNKVISLEPIS